MDALRKALGQSKTAAVLIVALWVSAVAAAFSGFEQALMFLANAVATRVALGGAVRVRAGDLPATFVWILGIDLVHAAAEVWLAWGLARWVYGMGPLEVLTECCRPLLRRKYV